MDLALLLLAIVIVWQVLRMRYQRSHITLLKRHLSSLQLERYLENLSNGYTRAIQEDNESRQQQVFETLHQTENAAAAQLHTLAEALEKEDENSTRMGTQAFCVPYIELLLPAVTRDFRQLVRLHAKGFRTMVDNHEQLDTKSRAFHLSAELLLFQHSCHWYCKSRAVADARLVMRHQVTPEKVLDSVSPTTRAAYQQWLQQRSS